VALPKNNKAEAERRAQDALDGARTEPRAALVFALVAIANAILALRDGVEQVRR
jgi:hypothetical protein